MPGFTRLEVVVLIKGQPQKIGSRWFPIDTVPACNVRDEDGNIYIATQDYLFLSEKPKDTV